MMHGIFFCFSLILSLKISTVKKPVGLSCHLASHEWVACELQQASDTGLSNDVLMFIQHLAERPLFSMLICRELEMKI